MIEIAFFEHGFRHQQYLYGNSTQHGHTFALFDLRQDTRVLVKVRIVRLVQNARRNQLLDLPAFWRRDSLHAASLWTLLFKDGHRANERGGARIAGTVRCVAALSEKSTALGWVKVFTGLLVDILRERERERERGGWEKLKKFQNCYFSGHWSTWNHTHDNR